jgi:hypothetical protein
MQARARLPFWIGATVAVALGVLLPCALLEGAIRLWKRDVAFQPDPQLIRSLRTHVTRKIYSLDSPEVLQSLQPANAPAYLGMDYTNNVGLRMKDDVIAGARDERRILLLGDSFVEAEEVPDEQRFYALVQHDLDQRHDGGRRWRVLNAGIQNGAPSQYILQLRRYLAEFHPDVVLAFIAPNDGADDFNFEDRFGFELDEHGIPVRPQTRARLWLLQKWWTLRYLDVAAQKQFPGLYDRLWPERLPGADRPDWWAMLCNDGPREREWFSKKTARYIRELKRMTEASGARFGIFLIQYMWTFPDEPFFTPRYPTMQQTIDSMGCLRGSARPYREFMHQFLDAEGIRYHDPFDALLAAKQAAPREKLWNFYDYHFTPAGHRLVAGEVMKLLDDGFASSLSDLAARSDPSGSGP